MHLALYPKSSYNTLYKLFTAGLLSEWKYRPLGILNQRLLTELVSISLADSLMNAVDLVNLEVGC